MDMSGLSDSDLKAIADNDWSKVSASALMKLSGQSKPANKFSGTQIEGVAKGIKDPLTASAQMLAHAVPSGWADSLNKGVKYVNELPIVGPVTKALGMTPMTAAELDKDIQQSERQYQADRIARGRDGIDWSRLAGNLVGTLPLAVSGAAPTALGRMGAATVQGAGLGALSPVVENQDNFASEKARQMGVGALSGFAGGVLGEGLARVARPAASMNPDVKLLRESGVNLTPGQVLGGKAKALEDRFTSVPYIGDTIQSARKTGVEDFNRAVYGKVTEKVGQVAPTEVGREGVAAIRQNVIDPAYKASRQNVRFVPDAQFGNDLSKITGMVQRLPETERKAFSATIDDELFNRLTGSGNGMMDGRSFKDFESALTKEAKKLHSGDAWTRDLGAAYKEVLTSARQALERSNPAAAKELQNVNAAFSQFAPVRQASASLGAEGGVFTPAQLLNSLKAADRTAGKRAFSEGGGALQQLAEAGKAVMPNKIPDSGTAGRGLTAAVLLGGGAMNPTIPAAGLGAWAGSEVLYSEPMRKLLAQLLSNRGTGQTADEIAQAIRYGMPLLGVSAASNATQ